MTTTSPNATLPKGDGDEADDAIELLTADHEAVKQLFTQFEELTEDEDEQKAALVARICGELTVHAQVEEELFYPAMREAIDDDDMMDEADIEHASARELIAQLGDLEPGDDHYDARVTVLREYVEHHVKEEEGEMFPRARKADLDLAGLGQDIAARKEELKAELGVDEDEPMETPMRATRSSTSTAERRR
jgi:hemerythrin superfamily protein